MPGKKIDLAACLLIPSVVLVLSSVSLLTFRLPSRADTPIHVSQGASPKVVKVKKKIKTVTPTNAQVATVSTQVQTANTQAATPNNPVPSMKPADDDGDGDELLEHWGDPKYGREERIQLVGMGALFLGATAMQIKRMLRTRRLVHASKA